MISRWLSWISLPQQASAFFQGEERAFLLAESRDLAGFWGASWKEKEQEGGTAVPAPAPEEQGNASLSCGTLFGY